MKQIPFANHEVSVLVNDELRRRQWSVRKCCEEFNRNHFEGITNNEIPPLDKDFVQRIKSGKFRVLSDRILRLCSFLELDLFMRPDRRSISVGTEIQMFERFLVEKPHLTISLMAILENLLATKGDCNEVR